MKSAYQFSLNLLGFICRRLPDAVSTMSNYIPCNISSTYLLRLIATSWVFDSLDRPVGLLFCIIFWLFTFICNTLHLSASGVTTPDGRLHVGRSTVIHWLIMHITASWWALLLFLAWKGPLSFNLSNAYTKALVFDDLHNIWHKSHHFFKFNTSYIGTIWTNYMRNSP
jgi:hypothetical protein